MKPREARHLANFITYVFHDSKVSELVRLVGATSVINNCMNLVNSFVLWIKKTAKRQKKLVVYLWKTIWKHFNAFKSFPTQLISSWGFFVMFFVIFRNIYSFNVYHYGDLFQIFDLSFYFAFICTFCFIALLLCS